MSSIIPKIISRIAATVFLLPPDDSFDIEPFIGRGIGVRVVSRVEDWKLGGAAAPKLLRKELSNAGLLGEWRAVPQGLPSNTFAIQIGRKLDPSELNEQRLMDAFDAAAEEMNHPEMERITKERDRLRLERLKGLTNLQMRGSYFLPAPKTDSRTNSVK